MAPKFVVLFLASLLILTSCRNQKSSSGTEIKPVVSSLKKNTIVSSTTTNKEGISLKYTFDNSDGTCILELNGELIELKQERTASGIKYSNEHFVYTNWHGETKLFSQSLKMSEWVDY